MAPAHRPPPPLSGPVQAGAKAPTIRVLYRLARPTPGRASLSRFPLSDHLRQVIALLDSSLSLNGRSASFNRDTPLLGALPELDSMAVAALLTGIEETFGLTIGDDEIDGTVFATVGSLADFIEQKLH